MSGLCDSVQERRRAFAASVANVRVDKMQGISLFAEELLGSQDGLLHGDSQIISYLVL